MRKLVCIHGWSDNSHSFDPLIQHFSHSTRYIIKLADFITLDDSVCVEDLVDAMQEAWNIHGLIGHEKSIDVITHSTGALILRAWLQRYYPKGNAPILHLLMLAPPNFGSHLAHKGRAFFGRMTKGIDIEHPFEVGAQLLNALELASTYTWQLAMQDCFGDYSPFGAHDIMTTICIGASGYNGIAAIANMPGSDGVVPIASSQLAGHLLKVHYNSGNALSINIQASKAQVAFAVLPKRNHSTILRTDDAWELSLFHEALHVTPEGFQAFCQRIVNAQHFQQTIMCVQNQYKQMVEDYRVTFSEHNAADIYDSQDLQAHMVQSVHTNTIAPALRAFTLDTSCLEDAERPMTQAINITLTAEPNLHTCPVNAGYAPCSPGNHRAICLSPQQFADLFKPNTTLLIDWQVTKEHREELYTLHSAQIKGTVL